MITCKTEARITPYIEYWFLPHAAAKEVYVTAYAEIITPTETILTYSTENYCTNWLSGATAWK